MTSSSASKSQDSSTNSTADWFALVQLQQQLLLQQQTYAAMQQPQAASVGCYGLPAASGPAASILYPTSPGAISVGKFPNPQTVNRLLGKDMNRNWVMKQ